MGEVIRKTAAAGDIFADVHTTLLAAAARGGALCDQATQFLGPTEQLALDVSARLAIAEEAARGPRLVLQARDEEADDLLVRLYEECWNLAGRAVYDPILAILFPGGSAAYTEGPTAEQPIRMALLADLLAAHLHPAIPGARADEMAELVLTSAEVLRAAVAEAEVKITSAALLSRTRGALAVAAAVQLSRLKRLWLASGRSEAEIHAIIPDRPRPKKVVTEATST